MNLRKQAEEAVSRSQKTFAELVERSPFGTYIVDSQFRIAMMNAASQNGAFRNVRPVIGRRFRRGHAHPLARTRRRGNHRPLPPHARHRRAVLLAALRQPAPRRGDRRSLRVGTASHDAAGRPIRRHLLLLRFHEAARGRGGAARERATLALGFAGSGRRCLGLEPRESWRGVVVTGDVRALGHRAGTTMRVG